MRLSRLITFCIMVFACCFLSACSVLRDPRTNVLSAHIGEQSDDAIVLNVVVEIENPNQEPLALREFEYALAVDGRQVFHARRSGEATVSANRARTVTLPAVIPLARLGTDGGALEGRSWRVRGTVLYLPPGEIREIFFDAGIYRPRAGLKGQGVVPGTAGVAAR